MCLCAQNYTAESRVTNIASISPSKLSYANWIRKGYGHDLMDLAKLDPKKKKKAKESRIREHAIISRMSKTLGGCINYF